MACGRFIPVSFPSSMSWTSSVCPPMRSRRHWCADQSHDRNSEGRACRNGRHGLALGARVLAQRTDGRRAPACASGRRKNDQASGCAPSLLTRSTTRPVAPAPLLWRVLRLPTQPPAASRRAPPSPARGEGKEASPLVPSSLAALREREGAHRVSDGRVRGDAALISLAMCAAGQPESPRVKAICPAERAGLALPL
jgi:hypothetical protein